MGIRKRESGFSVVEMIMVLCLLAFMTAVGGYGFWQLMPRYRLNGAVQSIVSDFQLARMKAIGQNCSYRIRILPGENQYFLEKESSTETTRWPGVPEGIIRKFSASNTPYYYPGVELETSSNHPVFSPRGTVVGTTVVLKNSSGQRKITLSSLGRVKVQEG
jgi:Tfp pilus assembly protein FimT